jgi:hypothetical protein
MYAEELDDSAGWQPLYTTPPAAPVQPKPEYKFCDDGKVILKNPEILSQRYRDTTPPAQPAVPDAIIEAGESPEFRDGWNECRETMLQMLKARKA